MMLSHVWAQRRRTRLISGIHRRYKRPKLIGSYTYSRFRCTLFPRLMGCRRHRVSGLAFHCLYTLRPLGLAGLAKATFYTVTYCCLVSHMLT